MVLAKGFERFFVTHWEAWDQVTETDFQFYNAILSDELKEITGKESVDVVVISLEQCIIQLLDEGQETPFYESKFELKLIKE